MVDGFGEDRRSPSRRALMQSAGLALGASFLAPDRAAAAAGSSDAAIWSAEYWAHKGNVSLYMYRKRVGTDPRPVLFLVHGSSFGCRSSFDLTVPGRADYSLMDRFAELGFDVWTMDHEGYGRSSRTASNSDIASGVEDLKAAMPVVERETGQSRYHFCGQSSGGLRAGAFANQLPERVDRLVLDAFVWTGEGAPEIQKRKERVAELSASNQRKADMALYESIFNRDMPGTSEPILAQALAASEARYGNTVPTGTYLDMATKLPLVDPLKLKGPVQIIRGEFDGIATEEDLFAFFAKLPHKDKQFVFLSGSAHVSPFGINRHRFWHAMNAFLAMPPRRDVSSSL
jgi:pimeloyl-ACP methyl ester carboxylesterase